MTKKITAMIVSLACLCLANTAYCGWSGVTTITSLLPQTAQLAILVEFSSPYSTCNGGTRFMLDTTKPDYKTQAAALTAAFIANRKIAFMFIDETACAPRIGNIQILTY